MIERFSPAAGLYLRAGGRGADEANRVDPGVPHQCVADGAFARDDVGQALRQTRRGECLHGLQHGQWGVGGRFDDVCVARGEPGSDELGEHEHWEVPGGDDGPRAHRAVEGEHALTAVGGRDYLAV